MLTEQSIIEIMDKKYISKDILKGICQSQINLIQENIKNAKDNEYIQFLMGQKAAYRFLLDHVIK